MLKNFTSATEKIKRSWTYMRENGVDRRFCFFIPSLVLTPALLIPKKKGKKCLKGCGPIP